jgi:hypothetical protein
MVSPPEQQPPDENQSREIISMKLWTFLIVLFLICIAAALLIKSSLLNSQSPAATTISIFLVVVGLVIPLIQLFYPNGLLGSWTRPPVWLTSTFDNPRRVKLVNIGIPTIGIICIIGILLIPPIPQFSPTLTVLSTPTLSPSPIPTPTPSLTPTPTPCTGQPTNSSVPFAVFPNYDPSGYVGDTGDITVAKDPNLVRFTYITKGRGPYEWDYKYIDGKLNPNPSRIAGVLYLNPPDNWGTDSHCGFDLRGRHTLTWKAHSLSGSVNIEFVVGGVVWQWDTNTHTKVAVPYPDSLPHMGLGIKQLTSTWQTFTYDLSSLPANYLRAVVAGFGWVITWDSNGGQFTGSGQPRTFVFEIQDIFYQ